MLQSLKPLTTIKTTSSAGARVRNAKVGRHIESFDAELTRLSELIQEFKELMYQADRAALKNHGQFPLALLEKEKLDFCEFVLHLNTTIGTESALPAEVKERVSATLQKEVLLYLALAETADRIYSKPRGYAGDFLTIAMMYENKPGGSGRIGALVDASCLATPAAAAVRNSCHLLGRLIYETLARNTTFFVAEFLFPPLETQHS